MKTTRVGVLFSFPNEVSRYVLIPGAQKTQRAACAAFCAFVLGAAMVRQQTNPRAGVAEFPE